MLRRLGLRVASTAGKTLAVLPQLSFCAAGAFYTRGYPQEAAGLTLLGVWGFFTAFVLEEIARVEDPP